jgi:hypothetical protein
MFKPHRGGRKVPHDEKTRAAATEYAERHGAAAAAARFKVPAGTVRSWVRRAQVRAEARVESDNLIEQVRLEGARIVAEREAVLADPVRRAAAEAEYERKRLAKLRWVEASPEERESMERPD